MTRLQVGVVRYASVATAIGRALGSDPEPDFRFAHGRITLTFRRLGASRWPEAKQIEYAFQVAAVARTVLSADSRRAVRRLVMRAIVVAYEDARLVHGCDVVSRWECVVPVASSPSVQQREIF